MGKVLLLASLQALQLLTTDTRTVDTPWKRMGVDTEATYESERRMARRLHQARALFKASPAARRFLLARARRRRRHPYCDVPPMILWMWCRQWGRELGGRPPKARRCTKLLGTRHCWNWRVEGTTRCYRHQYPPATVEGSPDDTSMGLRSSPNLSGECHRMPPW